MFGQKKTSRPSASKKKHDLGMFGLGMDPSMEDGDDDDDDLEAELAALQGNQPKRKPPKSQQKVLPMADINKLAAECMEDLDDNIEDDDNVEDDAELLAELEGLNPMESNVSKDATPALVPSSSHDNTSNKMSSQCSQTDVIAGRKTMYETAIASAEKDGEGSKARRYKRGLKDIEKMLKAAEAGKSVNMDELPPPVATGGASQPAPQESSEPSGKPHPPPSTQQTQKPLIDLGAPENLGNVVQPKPSIHPPNLPSKTPTNPPNVPSKTLINPPTVLSKTPEKTPNVLSNVPEKPPNAPSKPPEKPLNVPSKPAPAANGNEKLSSLVQELSRRRNEYKKAAVHAKKQGDLKTAREYLLTFKDYNQVIEAAKEGTEIDLSQCPQLHPSGAPTPKTNVEPTQSEVSLQSSSSSESSPPTTALEALQQRLQKYQSGVDEANNAGNSGKARRMGRIVKQYQAAIRDHKANKPVNYDELPVPPGYAPIPTETPPKTTAPRQAPSAPAQQQQQQPATKAGPPSRAPSQNVTATTRNQKELQFLIGRQKEFKMAALQAKKQGDLATAKEYLRSAKGFDSMIEAAKNGLRVDLSKIPPSPNVEKSLDKPLTPSTDFVMVREEDCTADGSNRDEVFASIEKSLKHQYEMCKKNMQHYSYLGDIESSKKFEKSALNSRKDYDAVQNAFKHGNPPPRYHYENRTFTIIRSNTDLGDQDCELTIVKCINVPLPSGYSKDDMKIYITYEFPFPNDQPQCGYTEAVKHSVNPEFKQSFKLAIDRKNRALSRICRRQNVKLEVKHARGFLKGDKTIAQAAVKLAPFDNKSDIHECVDLMDPDKGRKAVGGKIEVKLRIREPLANKDVEIMTEKWLVIDAYVVPTNRPISATPTRKVDHQSSDTKPKSANMSKVCVIE